MDGRPKPKLHHFIPQVYLRYFSPDGKMIYRHDKRTRNKEFFPIKKLAAIKHYYNFRGDTYLENPFFSDLESEYPKLIERLNQRAPLENERDYLSALMGVMYVRVPKQRNRWKKIFDELSGFFAERFSRLSNREGADEIIKERGKEPSQDYYIIAMLAELDTYLRLTEKNYFVVAIAERGSHFVTCDNPADELFLPLTPTMFLFSLSKKRSADYIVANESKVKILNSRTLRKAYEYVFALNSKIDYKNYKLFLLRYSESQGRVK